MTNRYTTAHAKWKTQLRTAAAEITTDYDHARNLLVGGTWINGPFRFLGGAWISTSGAGPIVVQNEDVQAAELDGEYRKTWSDLLANEPAPDCENSGLIATVTNFDARDPETGDHPETAATIGEWAYCYICEGDVLVVDDGAGAPVFAAHDAKGRLITVD